VQDFEKFWATIHKIFLIANCQLPIVFGDNDYQYSSARIDLPIGNWQSPIGNHLTSPWLSVTNTQSPGLLFHSAIGRRESGVGLAGRGGG
jgi:hypothetical protein